MLRWVSLGESMFVRYVYDKHPPGGGFQTLDYSRLCISYWHGHAKCNIMSERNVIKPLQSVKHVGV